MSVLADALGVMRLCLAVAFPPVLARAAGEPRGGWAPLALFGAAAASDFLDGVLARRAGRPSRHGAILDVAADAVFVLVATAGAARLRLVPVAVPLAIAAAVAAYALASAGLTRRQGAFGLARSRVGHAAGVLNFALVGLVAGAVALPGAGWGPALRGASAVVIIANFAAVLARLPR